MAHVFVFIPEEKQTRGQSSAASDTHITANGEARTHTQNEACLGVTTGRRMSTEGRRL